MVEQCFRSCGGIANRYFLGQDGNSGDSSLSVLVNKNSQLVSCTVEVLFGMQQQVRAW